ncbi:AAA family ATPase [Cohnella nanjingensis]|uniref:AAA family ATPase n=1 Tax=Cohnella nanjingensis TaxID=1387779 RepID=A0A7X0RU20_9BACL|nr:AAA family ATPase [Cohnella nanjingensis]MBB6673679.1 AAA family ATPase [Cohnella nanjingensis]
MGALLKGYKSYDKSIFIPISKTIEEKYSVYIGNNGVGKSAILEALDTFFNSRPWNLTRGATKDEVYIAPIFLIRKDKFLDRIQNSNYYDTEELKENTELLETVEKLSSYFWNVSSDFNTLVHKWPHISQFINLRDELLTKYSRDEFFFLMFGVQFTSKDTYFSAFNDDIKKKLRDGETTEERELFKKFDKIRKLIVEFYSYVYLPVEQSVDEILKIEAKQMQTLMNKDVLEEIDTALTDKFNINSKERSFITFLNDHLNEFMRGINISIQQIDKDYNYGADLFIKKNLKTSDIREKILEAYFLKKSLKYNNKEITQLSSGEQRRALIDIAYAFLSNQGSRDRNIILAIDEPEVSMSISNCYSQFQRLEKLSGINGNQVIITTHWYGALPTINKGYLQHIQEDDGNISITQFNFFNYLEERKRFPNDVELKSMFDLASSILSSMKSFNQGNWIICEGSDDKLYLESILTQKDKFRILPVGGIGNVVKIYNLLSNPISSDKKEFNPLNNTGRVLCLIDTDNLRLNFVGGDKDNIVQLRRLQVSADNKEVKLIDPARQEYYSRTVMEDCLDPETYYQAITAVINTKGTEQIRTLFNQFTFNENCSVSTLSAYHSVIKPNHMDFYDKKTDIEEFLSAHDVKYLVAKEYSKICAEKGYVDHKLEAQIMRIFDYIEQTV